MVEVGQYLGHRRQSGQWDFAVYLDRFQNLDQIGVLAHLHTVRECQGENLFGDGAAALGDNAGQRGIVVVLDGNGGGSHLWAIG